MGFFIFLFLKNKPSKKIRKKKIFGTNLQLQPSMGTSRSYVGLWGWRNYLGILQISTSMNKEKLLGVSATALWDLRSRALKEGRKEERG